MQGIFFYEEGDWPPQKLGDLKKKMISKNNDFRIKNIKNNDFSSKNPQKVQKYWKSKNGIKTALRPLFKELWAN